MKKNNFLKKINNSSKKKSKPLVVFISGAGCDHTLWAYQNRYYANKGFSTLCVTLPGHGKNKDKPLDTIESMGMYIIKSLKKTVHDEFILISHSMGTLISIFIASKKIINISKMILIGAALPMKVSSYLLDLSKKDQTSAINNMINWSLPENVSLYGSQLIGMRLQHYLFRVMLETKKGVLFKDLNACNTFNLREDSLKCINTPTHFIIGEEDIMTPASNAIKLSKLLPISEVSIIKNCGHFHIFENPNKVRSIISKFLGV